MKTYNTITDYLLEAKPNDIIVLGGAGILDGFRAESKHDTYKVHKYNRCKVSSKKVQRTYKPNN